MNEVVEGLLREAVGFPGAWEYRAVAPRTLVKALGAARGSGSSEGSEGSEGSEP